MISVAARWKSRGLMNYHLSAAGTTLSISQRRHETVDLGREQWSEFDCRQVLTPRADDQEAH